VTEATFLDALGPDDRAHLLGAGRRRQLRRGSTLFSEGDLADSAHLLIRGRVKVVASGADGRPTLLAVRGPGDLVGELSVIDGEPRSAAAVALDDVEVVVIPRQEILRAIAERHGVALTLIAQLSRRLRDADRKRVEFAEQDALGRVTARLLELADRFGEPDGEGVRIGIALTQEEIAGWTGSSREAVARALRTMRERGWVETGRRDVVLRDLPALRRRADLG
jgi:CRP/FNR family transcriptional regulator, cyclic AMP receptor protein